MPMMRQFGLSHEAAIEQFIDLDYGDGSELLDAYAHSWKAHESGRETTGFLVMRTALLNRIGAAYAKKDARTFKATVDAFLANTLANSKVGSPSAAFLSFDLGLAISVGQHKVAKLIAQLTLRDTNASEQPYPTALCGHVLAAFTDLDMELAEKAAAALHSKCVAKAYGKLDCETFSSWAQAASSLARRSPEEAIYAHLKLIANSRRRWIDRELGRWLQGRNTDLSSSEFFDWPVSALAAVADGFGYHLDQKADAFAFSDWRWTSGKKQ